MREGGHLKVMSEMKTRTIKATAGMSRKDTKKKERNPFFITYHWLRCDTPFEPVAIAACLLAMNAAISAISCLSITF